MAQNCTILCPRDEPERLIESVKRLVDGRGELEIGGTPCDWNSITLRSLGSSLVLNRRVHRHNGDDFSRMMLGLLNYFREVTTPHEETKERVLRGLDDVSLAIGVVAEPSFDEEAGHFELIFGLAEEFDAMTWNGSGVLDPTGSLILDGDGESEL